MYGIINKLSPSYFTDLLLPKVSEISNFPLCNSESYFLPMYRLSLSNSSFFPSTLTSWNSLDIDIRNSKTYSSFKHTLANKFSVNRWLSHGQRKYSIIHTKLRHDYSGLNYDLYRFNLRDNPGCKCGFQCANSHHYFLECPIYDNIRNNLLLVLQIYGNINLNVILYGSNDLSLEENFDIVNAVHDYIKSSKRFDC